MGFSFFKICLESLLLRFSEKYHARKVRYWTVGKPIEHSQSTAGADYDRMAQSLADLIDSFVKKENCLLLDYGAGSGEITKRLMEKCQCLINGGGVEVADMSDTFCMCLKDKGFTVYPYDQLPEKRFDLIIVNCAFYYIHPKNQRKEIERLFSTMKDDGILFITDVPVLAKCKNLLKSKKRLSNIIMYIYYKLTHVYDFNGAGFFLDEKKVKKWYPNTIIKDCWNDYRSHFIIKKGKYD